ncbi:XRE family transcriptional regulator [Aeromicrobium endophyticum]|uniref:XRE family transcriptional regulator n=2 Tax=Aeromicrobium endophyticum TaxID=2292704 RepID=A0A371PDG7_9ACTN|nr:XRE family transcriptional regulator [Aeromicrobium endophyticum]
MVNVVDDMAVRIGAAVRRERSGLGLTISELARQAGVSKATISQLEAGVGNPSVETMWALAGALGVPFAYLVDEPPSPLTVIRAGDAPGIAASAGSYTAALLAASPPHARRDLYVVHADPGVVKTSDPHTRGTVEHVVLIAGSARVGPVATPVELAPGDYVAYAGDASHVFEALQPQTSAVLISEIR